MTSEPWTHIISQLHHVNTTVGLGLVTAVVTVVWLLCRKSSRHQPPGPAVYIPGIGHLLMMSKQPVQKLRQLRQKYGDVLRLYMGTYPVIIVSGFDVINEILLTRGTEFRNRPHSFLAEKLAHNKGLLNTNGQLWLEQRKNIVKTVKLLAASGGPLDHHIKKATERLTSQLNLLTETGKGENVNIFPFIKECSFFISFSLAYGRQPDFESEIFTSYLKNYEDFFRCLNLVILTTFIPWIHMVPGDPVGYRKCETLAENIVQNFVHPELDRLKNIHNNKQEENDSTKANFMLSLAGAYIKEMNIKIQGDIPTALSDEQLPYTISDVIAGSFETISLALCWILLYMIHYPEVQRRCRQEIKDNCHEQLDLTNFVYTQAMIMEVQRHVNFAPMPPSHCCLQDTYVRGYFIPKNTAIIINTDSLLMSTEVGEDAEVFRPERFIDSDGKLFCPEWFITFSAGKRACPGMIIAKKEILGFIIELLSKFHFSSTIKNGVEVLPPFEGVLGISYSPKPYNLHIRPVVQNNF